jgi:hypothetical protein
MGFKRDGAAENVDHRALFTLTPTKGISWAMLLIELLKDILKGFCSNYP